MTKTKIQNVQKDVFVKKKILKFKFLEELKIEENFHLDVIDKYAFKGLPKLRFLSLVKNPKLAQIYKATFSGIGNEQSLKIHLKKNGLQQMGPLSFKNLNNVRELLIDDECIFFQSNSLSSISVLDFVFIKGACGLSPETFSNTTRVHNLHISESRFDLTTRAFDGLSHVNHILIQNNQIPEIFEDTFGGSSTIGNIQIQTNKIGILHPRTFASTENLGTVVFTQNVIEKPLASPECILNEAQRFVFTDNTIFCGWVSHRETPRRPDNDSRIASGVLLPYEFL
ncbi:hypothetical protein FO519_005402 [Halicephalobus sp. NKZ332]|nr:hypothetical protein FO519_005402 [Halicephalobus sp. NKZ332]